MLKSFIHTGDFHLGRPFSFSQQGNYYGKSRRKELWAAFDQVIEAASQVELLLIAGDLFDSVDVLTMDIKRVCEAFRKIKQTWVIIVSGNHDYHLDDSPYDRVQWPENVYIFKDDQFRSVFIQDLQTEIYGFSWVKNSYPVFPADSFDRLHLKDDRYNILLLHGEVASKSSYLPLDLRRLEEKAFDSICLGHLHKPGITASGITYCGSPIPLNFGEKGSHGFFKVEIQTEGKRRRNLFQTIESRSFEDLEIQLTPEDSYADILEKALTVDARDRRMKNFYRLNFSGFIDPEIRMDWIRDDLEEEFYYLETDCRGLELDIDIDQLLAENEANAIGQFLHRLQLISDPEIRQKAILYSIEAMIAEGVLQ